LTEAELRERRQTIMGTFHKMKVNMSELPDGYAYSFAATSESILYWAAKWRPSFATATAKQHLSCSFVRYRIFRPLVETPASRHDLK
jgi:hypothetical protein